MNIHSVIDIVAVRKVIIKKLDTKILPRPIEHARKDQYFRHVRISVRHHVDCNPILQPWSPAQISAGGMCAGS